MYLPTNTSRPKNHYFFDFSTKKLYQKLKFLQVDFGFFGSFFAIFIFLFLNLCSVY